MLIKHEWPIIQPRPIFNVTPCVIIAIIIIIIIIIIIRLTIYTAPEAQYKWKQRCFVVRESKLECCKSRLENANGIGGLNGVRQSVIDNRWGDNERSLTKFHLWSWDEQHIMYCRMKSIVNLEGWQLHAWSCNVGWCKFMLRHVSQQGALEHNPLFNLQQSCLSHIRLVMWSKRLEPYMSYAACSYIKDWLDTITHSIRSQGFHRGDCYYSPHMKLWNYYELDCSQCWAHPTKRLDMM